MSVSHAEVCDGVSNCPVFKEDEKYCDTIGWCIARTHETNTIRLHCLHHDTRNTDAFCIEKVH